MLLEDCKHNYHELINPEPNQHIPFVRDKVKAYSFPRCLNCVMRVYKRRVPETDTEILPRLYLLFI